MSEIAELRAECCSANMSLPKLGLVDLTFGNVSIYDPKLGFFAIKPSGVPYDRLTPGSMIILDLEGNIVSGQARPSSDTPTHRRLFQAFGPKGVRSIVHTHSRNATSFCQARRPIPCLGTTHADYFLGEIPVSREMTVEEITGGAYEWETGNVIVECLGATDPLDMPAVLVWDHAPFVWSTSGPKALETAFALEVVAEMAWKSLHIGALSRESNSTVSPALLNKHFFRKHGPSAYYGQVKKS
jgi:L-ribulose-5-phosphate 4-epimerase